MSTELNTNEIIEDVIENVDEAVITNMPSSGISKKVGVVALVGIATTAGVVVYKKKIKPMLKKRKAQVEDNEYEDIMSEESVSSYVETEE